MARALATWGLRRAGYAAGPQSEPGLSQEMGGSIASLGGPSYCAEAIPRWKRPLDLSIGIAALVLFAPVMALAAALVRLSSPGPVMFRQTRIGWRGRPYTLLKFRTMYASADDGQIRQLCARELSGEAKPEPRTQLYRLDNDPRVTSIGRIFRQYSIDELPQLINVLRGEMSLVGPRPAMPCEVEMFTPEQRRRHNCLPGITGLWQVKGRNRFSVSEMLALDIEYVDHCSLRLDLAILLRTPRAVLFDRFTR
jgi:lipopolysaccharide/colanic/teichoic acid biosynthesis glycosyltransferase